MSVGNTKTQGNKGNNFPFQFRNLQLLGEISASVAGIVPPGGGLATEATLISVLNAIVASDQDIEILLVRDEAVGNGCPLACKVLKQVTNYQTGVPVVTYENVDGTTYVPAPNPIPVYVYLDPSAVLNLVLAELITLNATALTLSTEVTLAALLTELGLKADLTETQPVSAASLPLPTGAATETTLAAINAKLVSGTDIGDVTINNAAGAAAVNIQDGGNSITIDATSLPLPTGAATETTLLSVDTEVTGLNTPVTALAVGMVRSSGAGSVTIGKRSIAIFNAGNVTGTVLGANLLKGESVSFSADGLRDTLAAIAYDATGTDFLITTVG